MDSATDQKKNQSDNDALVLKELRELRASNDVLVRQVHALTRQVEKLLAQRNADPVCVSCASGFPKPPTPSIWNVPSPNDPVDVASFLRRDRMSTNMPPEISNFLAKNPFGNMPTFHGPVPFPPAVGHHQRFGPKIPGASLHAEQPNLMPMFDDFFEPLSVTAAAAAAGGKKVSVSEIEDLISLDRASANVPLPFPRSENVV